MLLQPVAGVRSTIGNTAQAQAGKQTLQSTVGGSETVRTRYVIPGQRLGTNRLPIHGVSVPVPVGDGVGAVPAQDVAQPRAGHQCLRVLFSRVPLHAATCASRPYELELIGDQCSVILVDYSPNAGARLRRFKEIPNQVFFFYAPSAASKALM